jgi:hypothetical protein
MMKLYNYKYAFTFAIIFATGIANAISTADLCKLRGNMLEAMAKERDKGVKKADLVDFTHKQFGKYGVKRNSINEYANAIYLRRDVSPSVFNQLGELTCLQEFGN